MSGDLMFGKETTYGTAVATSRAIEVASDSLNGTRATSTVASTRWGALAARRRNTINLPLKGSGDVELGIRTRGMGLLWQAAFGGASTSTLVPTTTVYQQVHRIANPLSSLTLQKLVPAINADGSFTDKPFTFPGVIISGFEVNVPQNDVATVKFSLLTQTVKTDVPAATPVYPATDHVLHFAGACLFRDAIVKPTATALATSSTPLANVKSMTLSVNSGASAEGREFFCAGGLSARPLGQLRTVTGTITAEFTSDGPFVDAFMNGSTMGLMLNLAAVEDSAEVVQFVMPEVTIDGDLPTLGNPGEVVQMSLKFTAWEDSAGDILIGVARTYDTAL